MTPMMEINKCCACSKTTKDKKKQNKKKKKKRWQYGMFTAQEFSLFAQKIHVIGADWTAVEYIHGSHYLDSLCYQQNRWEFLSLWTNHVWAKSATWWITGTVIGLWTFLSRLRCWDQELSSIYTYTTEFCLVPRRKTSIDLHYPWELWTNSTTRWATILNLLGVCAFLFFLSWVVGGVVLHASDTELKILVGHEYDGADKKPIKNPIAVYLPKNCAYIKQERCTPTRKSFHMWHW